MATLLDPRYATVPPPPSIDAAQVDHVLDGLHQIAFEQAIRNVLETEIAETTFAQIIDGLPLKDVAHATAGLSSMLGIYTQQPRGSVSWIPRDLCCLSKRLRASEDEFRSRASASIPGNPARLK